jgi:hypothetical protein
MHCSRCQGLMVQEPVSARRRWIWLWACVACGDRVDETIRFHRAMQRQETEFERRARVMREIRLLTQEPVTTGT